MTLTLDARQRAMLAEMGVPVAQWLPAAAPVAAPEPVPEAASSPAARAAEPPAVVRAQPLPAVQPAPAAAPALLEGVQPLRGEVASMDWDALEQAVAGCRACGLCEGRRNTVFGTGVRQAEWMVVGEAPGEQEDLQGEPFVGPAGQLLDNMLRAIAAGRDRNVFIANVLKCRPPGNRNPGPAEVAQCEPFLRRQVELVRPKLILAMGRFAVQSLLGSTEPIGKLRGQVHDYAGVPVIVTYHPAYLLRNLPDKAKAWADLCLARDTAERA